MSEEQRESMDVDVVIVGGGVAGLSTAIHLQNLIQQYFAEKNENKDIPSVFVLEKGSQIGSHSLSGAVLDTSALTQLLRSDEVSEALSASLATPVTKESVYYLGSDHSIQFPFVPAPLKNQGNQIISLCRLNKWLAQKAEKLGVSILPGFAATQALYEGDRVIGVRTGDKGRDKKGAKKSNFEMGMDLKAKITIFAEGPRGSLFKQVACKLNLRKGKAPDTYSQGVKEVIALPKGRKKAGEVIHTLGYPLVESVGGSFLYTLPEDQLALGLVGYLGTQDPLFDPHLELQKLKKHPLIYRIIEGGEVISYGSRVIPAGGWYSMPQLYHNGMLVVGDSAGFVDDQKLKGIHLSMQSGLFAAQTTFEALLKNDFSKDFLKMYETQVFNSDIKKQLYRVRHFHHTLSRGLFTSAPLLALQEIMKGRRLLGDLRAKDVSKDSKTTEPVVEIWGVARERHQDRQLPCPDGKLFFDKLSSVSLTGTQHEENSPNHLLVQDKNVCSDICHDKFRSPCHFFCPAHVYEMVPDEKLAHLGMDRKKLQINYTNCIHCKTCDIKCPFDNIAWTPPEGGGGPNYHNL